MNKDFDLSSADIAESIKRTKSLMHDLDIDALYISSNDQYLNEYTPLWNNYRYYLTGFTGSTADVLVVKSEDKVRLYVDGRYHEQVDKEVDPRLVNPVKSLSSSLGGLMGDIKSEKFPRLGIMSERTPSSFYTRMKNVCEVVGVGEARFSGVIDLKAPKSFSKPYLIPEKFRADETSEKLQRMDIASDHSIFISAMDSLTWMTNILGHQFNCVSSFMGFGLATSKKVYVFIDPTHELDKSVYDNIALEFIMADQAQMHQSLKELRTKLGLKTVEYHTETLNFANLSILADVFKSENILPEPLGVFKWQSIKTEKEKKLIRESFLRSSKAIYNTIKYLKETIAKEETISERDLYEKTSEFYKGTGAVQQSFNTICGVSENGSIVHYGDPKADRIISKFDTILLDSGGYYEAGFATDTTRVFTASPEAATAEKKKMYTLVLKGTMSLQNAIFPDGAHGAALDMLARKALYEFGEDYRHGTGHGVGFNVHEPGVRITWSSGQPMRAGQLVSIEPGLYYPGVGGVRIENVAFVEEHPEFPGFLRFENVVFTGLEPDLIDWDLLTAEETKMVQDYQNQCEEKGLGF